MKSKSKKYQSVTHTARQKFFGAMALLALFVCGVMVGWSVGNVKTVSAPVEPEQVQRPVPQVDTEKTCLIIENLLLEQLPPANADSEYRIIRAKIYANLSERGCNENSEKYIALAQQELEIARALEDDEFDNDETIEMVETYKRLNMQAAAEEIFETAKKLTNPAIDFILEVEKIINEQ